MLLGQSKASEMASKRVSLALHWGQMTDKQALQMVPVKVILMAVQTVK